MNALEAAILGIVQGFTEFLPISSSAHLIFTQYLLGLKENFFYFDLFLHAGTLMATLIIFYKELWKLLFSPRAITLIICAGIPTAIMGFILKDVIDSIWTLKISCISLFVTGVMLWLTRKVPKKSTPDELFSTITYQKAFLIGLAQGFAIFPGISRSGATISAALFCGTGRKDAGSFSFLLSIPSLIGAFGLKFIGTSGDHFPQASLLLMGFLFSFITGVIALSFLLKLILKGKFYVFSYYCWFVSILGFLALTFWK